MNHRAAAPLVGVVMGSRSDWETLQHAVAKLDLFGIANACCSVSQSEREPMTTPTSGAAARWFMAGGFGKRLF